MEDSAILKMVEYAFYNRFFIIDVIVSDDENKIRALIKYPSKGSLGQVIKASKVKLDEEIPDLSFLADPYHSVKVVANHTFSVVKESRAQRCGCTKADDLRLKKYWEYMIKKNRGKKIEDLSEASRVPLEHMFNSN